PDAISKETARGSPGAGDRVAVHLPGGQTVGTTRASPQTVRRAGSLRQSTTVEVSGGVVRLRPAVLNNRSVAVVEVFVPDSELTAGTGLLTTVLFAMAVALVGGSVLVADRLAGTLVSATRALGSAARAFGGGDLRARVVPAGPPELVEAGSAFNTMADQVLGLLDGERELAADLSHRLRTPLTALRLDAEALDEGPDGDRIREAVSTLEREVDEVIRSARRPLDQRGPHWCDLAEVSNERIAFWSVLAEDEQRAVRVSGAGRRVPVAVPRADLVSVVDVLLGNVFRHTPQGTGFALSITVHASTVLFTVEDGGPGIPHPRQAVRRGESGSGSTGLGLDIVRRVADAAGGSVRIGRGPMGGARVTVVLAAVDPASRRTSSTRLERLHQLPAVPRGTGVYHAAHKTAGVLGVTPVIRAVLASRVGRAIRESRLMLSWPFRQRRHDRGPGHVARKVSR
ncbi:MAG TPA: HAMP domain-containing sensor histidine kinase, partial [Cryptosporangiaceae bacterium]|nr:HAMP domain-containing sensor histidine kinase [Cryptosporangiaceae bacterium]